MKMLISFLIVISIVSLSATTAFAAEKTAEKQARYKSFTGKVKEIRKSETVIGTTYVLLENDEAGEANLVLTEDTYFINDEEIKIGSEVTGYYDATAMMILIYPPQYMAAVVMVSNNNQNIKVDLFDDNLVSADNFLKLNISADTQVVTKDGKSFKGDLANRKLAVFYDASTRSIPAQTNPNKVVVLSEPLVPDTDTKTYYGSFKGTVTNITNIQNNKDKNSNKIQITLQDSDGLEAIFTISKDTYRTNDEQILIGSVLTGYFDATMFRIMIYPAQYEAEVIAVERSNSNIKVDYFDNKLTSADGKLRLNMSKDTELVYKDGTEYNGKPIKSNLVVIYGKETKSIPAQTEPIKVIVLEENKSNDDNKNIDESRRIY